MLGSFPTTNGLISWLNLSLHKTTIVCWLMFCVPLTRFSTKQLNTVSRSHGDAVYAEQLIVGIVMFESVKKYCFKVFEIIPCCWWLRMIPCWSLTVNMKLTCSYSCLILVILILKTVLKHGPPNGRNLACFFMKNA